jgi:hypothetical protein
LAPGPLGLGPMARAQKQNPGIVGNGDLKKWKYLCRVKSWVCCLIGRTSQPGASRKTSLPGLGPSTLGSETRIPFPVPPELPSTPDPKDKDRSPAQFAGVKGRRMTIYQFTIQAEAWLPISRVSPTLPLPPLLCSVCVVVEEKQCQ